MTPEEKRAYKRELYRKNKEKISKQNKDWKDRNKEKVKEANKKYYEENKENEGWKNKQKGYQKIYYETPIGIKNRRIGVWKHRGVICDNFDELYEKYINTEFCEFCNVELTEDKNNTKTTRCLDHDHETGLFRNIVCHSCNVKIG